MIYDNCPICNKTTSKAFSKNEKYVIIFDCFDCNWSYYPSLKDFPEDDDNYEAHHFGDEKYSIEQFEKLLKLKCLL